MVKDSGHWYTDDNVLKNGVKNITQKSICSNTMNIAIIAGEKKNTNECKSKPDESPAKDIVAMKSKKNYRQLLISAQC